MNRSEFLLNMKRSELDLFMKGQHSIYPRWGRKPIYPWKAGHEKVGIPWKEVGIPIYPLKSWNSFYPWKGPNSIYSWNGQNSIYPWIAGIPIIHVKPAMKRSEFLLSMERRNSCDAASNDERVDVVCPLVRVHGLKVHHVSKQICTMHLHSFVQRRPKHLSSIGDRITGLPGFSNGL